MSTIYYTLDAGRISAGTWEVYMNIHTLVNRVSSKAAVEHCMKLTIEKMAHSTRILHVNDVTNWQALTIDTPVYTVLPIAQLMDHSLRAFIAETVKNPHEAEIFCVAKKRIEGTWKAYIGYPAEDDLNEAFWAEYKLFATTRHPPHDVIRFGRSMPHSVAQAIFPQLDHVMKGSYAGT